jgi:hypothetical protein
MTAQFIHEGSQARTTGPIARTRPGPLRSACRRIRLAVHEMNYASRRVVEVQAPWTVDRHWHVR